VTKEIFIEILSEYYNAEKLTTISRPTNIEIIAGKATIITGVRRCGKSVLAQQLSEKFSFSKNKILSINFSDERLTGLVANQLGLVLDAYYDLQSFEPKKNDPLLIILDEIQLVPKWESFVDRLTRQPQYRLILTGSSSHFLSSDIATQMRGRSLSWELFPFSFAEYLSVFKIDQKWKTPRNKSQVLKSFNSYLIQGGFPETILSSDQLRHQILQEYFDSIFYKDLIERFKITEVFAAKAILKLLVSQVGSLYSISKLYDKLRSSGFKLHKSLVMEVLSGLEDAYAFFSLPIFTESQQKKMINPKKLYCIDNGLVTAIQSGFSQNTGRLLENYVYLKLRKNKSILGYYKTQKGHEIDFVVNTKCNLQFIQVCDSLNSEETRERELRALSEAIKENPKATGLIITRGKEVVENCPFQIISGAELEFII
jgi:predicted AAA+ superfamily ATPase